MTTKIQAEQQDSGYYSLYDQIIFSREVYPPLSNDHPISILQGFNSKFTHQIIQLPDGRYCDESYALDLSCLVGSPVFAVANGTVCVIKIDSDFSYAGEDPVLKQKALEETNLIIIVHGEGEYSIYCHLQKGGVAEFTDKTTGERRLLQVGDHVSTGQHIGYSGNTGYSTQPHLHFSLFTTEDPEFVTRTLPIEFLSGYDGLLEDRALFPECYR